MGGGYCFSVYLQTIHVWRKLACGNIFFVTGNFFMISRAWEILSLSLEGVSSFCELLCGIQLGWLVVNIINLP